ncbi:structural maintenance of chromosomes protein 2-like [Actinia tenebrosa]|uniref:Coiled-coil domain-containing protein 172 n=1 Tax=Actinia tenebrosa TaxID=6105 RepID=A0A6P8I551_ACTTE|nr:structural maintenance of chromosomes protein 2-like [Actinia tenebrosa]
MSVLNDLFKQILYSEECVRERFSRLRSINEDIQSLQLQIRDAEDELKSLQGSVVLKNQRLAEEEEKLKSLRIKKNVTDEQRKELEEGNINFQQEIKMVKEESESERKKFISAVQTFILYHDLSGHGKMKRDETLRNKVACLRKEKKEICKDLELSKAQEKQILTLREGRDKCSHLVNELSKQNKDLSKNYEKAKKETEALEKEKETMSKKPQNDPEFRRLSAELEAAKDGSMEGICEALTQELKELQQIYLKKELQKQKHLQQQQSKASYYQTNFKQRQRNTEGTKQRGKK